MATADGVRVTVATEKAVHGVLREIAQELWDTHGICVQSVRFSWTDVSTPGEQKLFVAEVEAETMTKA